MAEQRTSTRRTYQVYLYAVCLATILITLFATWQALYGVVRIAAPQTTASADGAATFDIPFIGDVAAGDTDEDAERDRGTAQLIENLLLALVAGAVFAVHWGWAGRLRTELQAAPPRTAPEGSGEAAERPQRPRRRPPSKRPRPKTDDE